ncbi:MAG: Cro/Cl family transcriptional regulator [Nitrospirales bacterium]|nr:MAG: Cro/Cl family transcriptional regulator [Nitrospirales bacterium]
MLQQATTDRQRYLTSSLYIDWETPAVFSQAQALAKNCQTSFDVTKACFEFVRDDIKHSWDHGLDPVTCKASDVLSHGTGYCYAKSHLLAALLRANRIPTGLCYQRLTINDNRPPFCLHGLNAVYLKEFGWYRVDPRGNKDGVNASFCPPMEQLAYPIKTPGEADLPEIWAEPLREVVLTLEHFKTYQDVANNLPDISIRTTQHASVQ